MSQESLRCSINKESGTNGKIYITLRIVWHNVVLIQSDSKSCKIVSESDHTVLYYTFKLSKNVFLPRQIHNSIPPLLYFGQTLSPPLSDLLFFCPPSKFTPPPPPHTHTHTPQRKNDRSRITIIR